MAERLRRLTMHDPAVFQVHIQGALDENWSDLGLDNNERQLLPSVDQIDLDYLLQAIEENKHNMSAAARHLGISRTTLYRLIKKYNLNV